MKKWIKRQYMRLFGLRREFEKNGSVAITSPEVLEAFTSNPESTFLVSFPRTGSHWLRLLMELYFERPSLVRVFYYPERTDYLTYHTHDLSLDVQHPRVIYLYREPVATIYSQMQYHGEDLADRERIAYWADLYGRHLDKWLVQETFTTQKTVLTYEGMQRDLAGEFRRLAAHFGETFDAGRLAAASARVTKEEVKRKTRHDEQVVTLRPAYSMTREVFREQHGATVWEALLAGRDHLHDFFEDTGG